MTAETVCCDAQSSAMNLTVTAALHRPDVNKTQTGDISTRGLDASLWVNASFRAIMFPQS